MKRYMAHRTILIERQCSVLFDLLTDEAAMLCHYTFADEDLEIIPIHRKDSLLVWHDALKIYISSKEYEYPSEV